MVNLPAALIPNENRFLRLPLVEHPECLRSLTDRKTMSYHLLDRYLSTDDEFRYLLKLAQREIPRADHLQLFPDQLVAWVYCRGR